LQEILFASKTAVSERLLGVEDELGAALADMGTGEGIPGGGYVNMWSGIVAALEDNQAVANLVSKLHQQVKANAGNVGAAMTKANQANLEATTLKTQLVAMYQTQRAEEEKLTRVDGQLYQFTLILNQTQQEFRQHNLASQRLPVGGGSVMGPVMVNGVPVEDAVAQLQLKIQVVQSRLRSDSVSIAGHVFESYEDTLAWVVAHCSPEDWQYVMDMLAFYSLIRPDGQQHDVMLQEEFNSSKAGYASSAQARLSRYFKMKVPGIFGADRFSAISDFSKWESTGIKKGFQDQVEEGVRALEASLSRSMSVHMTHKVEAHRIFLTLLTDSVQHMLKLHRMMEAQFFRYHSVLGIGCDDGNWILASQFAEAVFAGTWRARLLGADAFKETGQTRCAMYLWAALSTHRVLQGYIELGFIAHPDVSSVVVEHLIQTRVPMAMHEALKTKMVGLKASVKASVSTLEKLESRMALQATDFAKLHQEVKIALKHK
jgi:hypothetical protein